MKQELTAALSLGLGLLLAGGALAQSNTLTIEQRGTGNTLSVDQSDATSSEVGGLSILLPGTPGGDLAAAFPRTGTAQQLGAGNVADIAVGGFGGNVVLYQDNGAAGGGLLGNSATVNLDGSGSLAIVGQLGQGNTSFIDVASPLSAGTVIQNGDGNQASVEVRRAFSAGTVIQNGDGNDIGLLVDGIGTVATYIQNGSGLSPAAGAIVPSISGVTSTAVGVSVISNGANVTITQSQF